VNETSGRARRPIGPILLLSVALALLVGVGYAIAPHVSRSRIESWVGAAGAWGPAVLFAVQVLQIVVAPIPGALVPFLAGLLYGPLVGPLVAAGGTAAGSLAGYALGRYAGRPLAARWVGADALRRAEGMIGGKRWLALIPLFLFPLSPSDALCMAAGLIGVGWRQISIAVALGRLPKDAAVALAGAGLLRLSI
jgi:uncharacterized membrane protein YdjX (TVP38/TMEM64 family)